VLIVLWKGFARESGRKALAITLAALVLSPPFMLYASALRGYMLAALFTVGALTAARKYALGGKKRNLLKWFVFCFLSVGVMPSALAGLAAAGLYVLPYCGKKFWKNLRAYFLALTAFAAFAVFYAPIWKNLLNAFELKEGWLSPWCAVLAVFLALGATFAVPLGVGAFYHRPKWRYFPRTLIWLLPLGSLLLPVAPFPRVWFVLFPVFALLAASLLRRVPDKLLKISAAAVIVWGCLSLTESCRTLISPAFSLAGQDDFYAPWFVRRSFMPSDTARFVRRNFPGGRSLFVSFAADPWAMMCYYPGQILFDSPQGKVFYLPDNALIAAAVDEDTAVLGERFGGKLQEVYANETHKVYLLRKEK
jgi:hypothetical protein